MGAIFLRFVALLPGLLCLTSLPLEAAPKEAPSIGRPVLQAIEFGQSEIEGPVWAVLEASNGDLIVGSNRLSIFDQYDWTSLALPDAHAFRALARDPASDRIWVGALHELGYLKLDAQQRWRFHSLLEAWRRDTHSNLRDVWAVSPTAHGSLWLTSNRVARWDGERFTAWVSPGEERLIGGSGPDGLWYFDASVGLLHLGPTGDPTLIVPVGDIPGSAITWILPPQAPDNAVIFGTPNGVYRRDGPPPFERLSLLSETLGSALPGRAVALGPNRFAVGTFRSGVVIAGDDGRIIETIGREHGLPDNTVYTVSVLGDHLWIGYQGGVARVEGLGESSVLDRETGLGDGVPRAVKFGPEGTWIVTSKDVMLLAPDAHVPRPVLTGETLLRSAIHDGDALWVGGLGGIWRVTPEGARREHFSPSDVMQVIPSRRSSQGVIYLEDYELRILRPARFGGWVAKNLNAEIFDTPVSLTKMPNGEIWAGTVSAGIARFGWRDGVAPPMDRLYPLGDYSRGNQLPDNAHRIEVINLFGDAYAFTESDILRWSADHSHFEIAPEFSALTGLAAATSTDGKEAYWLVRGKDLPRHHIYGLLRLTRADGRLKIEALEAPGLRAWGVPDLLEIGPDALWIGSAEGLLRIAKEALVPAPPPPSVQVLLESQSATGGAPAMAAGQRLELPSHTSRIALRMLAETTQREGLLLQSRLVGADSDWAPPRRNNQEIFTGLEPGRYRFEARAIDGLGHTGPITQVEFRVPPPWYRRPGAMVAYGVLIAGVALGIFRWRLHRLRLKNDYLNRMVEKRTRELALSNVAKSDFLENISHEIRNPLNGLSGLLALLKDDNLGPREQELTRSLRSVSRKLMSVFEDVLTQARLDYGQVVVDPHPFLLRPLLEEVIDLFRMQATQQNQPLTLFWPEGTRDGFLGDAPKIRTIVENFVGNALKYAPGAAIELSLLNDPEEDAPLENVQLFIEVADQGPGIPPEEQVVVFSKFVRGTRAKLEGQMGTGLGLATCRSLAQLMGGEVTLHSTLGEGSAFTLALALPRAEVSADVIAPLPDLPTALDGGDKGRVLVVEDERYNRVALEGLGIELGYQVDVAENAETALRQIENHDYAVIFLDWELPGAKGSDVARAVRASPRGAAPIILATTAHDSDEIRRRCREAGMDEFLLKPYDTAMVQRIIATVEARRRGDQVAVAQRASDAGTPAEPFNRKAFAYYSLSKGEHESTAIQQFRQSLEQELTLLEEAMTERDLETIQFHAHRLRALAGLIGARDLNQTAKTLEEFAIRAARRHEIVVAWKRTQSSAATLIARLQNLAQSSVG